MTTDIETLADKMRRSAEEPLIDMLGPLTPWHQLPDTTKQIWIRAARAMKAHGLESELDTSE